MSSLVLWILIVIAAWILLAVVVAPLAGRFIRRGQRTPRELPHRPSPGTPRPPGPRHRIENAHTASLSATEIRAALEEDARRLAAVDAQARRDDRIARRGRAKAAAAQEER